MPKLTSKLPWDKTKTLISESAKKGMNRVQSNSRLHDAYEQPSKTVEQRHNMSINDNYRDDSLVGGGKNPNYSTHDGSKQKSKSRQKAGATMVQNTIDTSDSQQLIRTSKKNKKKRRERPVEDEDDE